jgi:hypothetical protein
VRGWQTPARHAPPQQPWPHRPQFAWSVVTSVHAPLHSDSVPGQVGVHAVPLHARVPPLPGAVQGSHWPPQHTAVGPHEVRSIMLPPGKHVGPASPQRTVPPVRQGLLGVHAAPGVHTWHVPELQIPLSPHPLPFAPGLARPVSVHETVPPEQSRVPRSHGFDIGVQLPPQASGVAVSGSAVSGAL